MAPWEIRKQAVLTMTKAREATRLLALSDQKL